MAPGLSQAAANVTAIESNTVSGKVQDAKLCFRATRRSCTVNRPRWCRAARCHRCPPRGPPGRLQRAHPPAPVAGTVNLTMPLSSFLGASGEPGEVVGFGPVAAAGGRALADRLVGERGSRWCLTLTGQDG